MPKAVKGTSSTHQKPGPVKLTTWQTSPGVLVECDPSIKAIILKIDSVHHDFIVEDLDEQTLVIKESKLKELKEKLDTELAETQQMPEDSETE
ncbi:MAG: TFIIH complex subunit tfb5 [Peltula sp. TS41687]|nr:MAG: TFIIH complex subunit tfb5 [Peltula sp. TS41687]